MCFSVPGESGAGWWSLSGADDPWWSWICSGDLHHWSGPRFCSRVWRTEGKALPSHLKKNLHPFCQILFSADFHTSSQLPSFTVQCFMILMSLSIMSVYTFSLSLISFTISPPPIVSRVFVFSRPHFQPRHFSSLKETISHWCTRLCQANVIKVTYCLVKSRLHIACVCGPEQVSSIHISQHGWAC